MLVIAALSGLFSSGLVDVSVHAQSGSDRVLVKGRIVSFMTRAHHAEKFVAVLTGDPAGEVLMADQTATRTEPFMADLYER